MTVDEFKDIVTKVTGAIAGKPVDGALDAELNRTFPAGGDVFAELSQSLRTGIDEGWLCAREHGGIKYGRVIDSSAETHGYSVDVVEMDDVVGPYHVHPKGEIDMIVPQTAGAVFDGHGKGWLVYGPGSGHKPTVAKGKAIVLYLLPDGEIEFTRPK
jgi:hypothetical protein